MEKWNLTKKTAGILVAAVAGVLVAGAGVVRATQPPDQITIDEALSIALKDAGKGSEEVTVTKQRPDIEDGIQTYDIEFFYFEGDSSVTEYDYEIEAATGRILERSRETEYVTRTPKKKELWEENAQRGQETEPQAQTEQQVQAEQQPKAQTQPQQQPQAQAPVQQPQAPAQQAQPAQQYIGAEAARAIAMQHAGVGAEALLTKEKQDLEDGQVVYEIEFRVGPVEYEYEIDAVTGTIREFDIDYDD